MQAQPGFLEKGSPVFSSTGLFAPVEPGKTGVKRFAFQFPFPSMAGKRQQEEIFCFFPPLKSLHQAIYQTFLSPWIQTSHEKSFHGDGHALLSP
ncbi:MULTISPECIES: hypothetical protein [unclassified Akkermansia]|uniref:hypothetical protein n=1 Tax=unclassified Akkermansia TaxID=2608915 RepID=UPI0007941C1D|nr:MULTISPECIES: hypothetical protein [unclassified Akkermansia]KXU52769.1 hypothetical protein HMPREF3039_03056 [Akkermansia sp. KLE1798]KZA04531.1 hypothetical protein HMPREF1326_01776 [Akkermansia sp. KLE1605]